MNPCGHSCLVLAPFVVGEKNGARVAWLIISFLAGTAVVRLVLGMSLGVVSVVIPDAFQFWADVGTASILIVLGFVNMIIPCPTVAIMCKYALDSASALKATVIFGIYATAIAVGGVVCLIFRVMKILEKLSQDGVDTALMRIAGVVTIVFAGYSLSPYVA